MIRMRKFINNLSRFQKIAYSIIALFLLCALPIAIPTLSRYKNRNVLDTVLPWDGSIATGYKRGTGASNNPYVISNGAELAYFAEQLQENNYENNYFVLGNDIIINNGVFSYDATDKVTYLLNDTTYFVDDYTGKYYADSLKTEPEVGSINLFQTLNGFKGKFDGRSYRILGLYITDEEKEELGLFTSLQGEITDLYVENSVINGGIITGGIASSTTNANIKNTLFKGYVIGKTNITKNIELTANILPIELNEISSTSNVNLTNNIPFIGSEILSTSLTGTYTLNNATDENTLIEINGVVVTNGSFDIDLGTTIADDIDILASSTSENASVTFTNVKYHISYNYSVTGGIIGKSNNTLLENVINKANIYGQKISGGLVGTTTNLLSINQSYNTGNINSSHTSGGLVGTIEKSEDDILISKCYNTGTINSSYIGGFIGIINDNTGSISINNVFDINNSTAIGVIANTAVTFTNTYSTSLNPIDDETYNESFNITTINNLKTKNYVTSNLLYSEFVSFNDLLINENNVWVYDENSLPILFIDDSNDPIASIHVGTYSWNNLSDELKTVKLKNNITFSIEEMDALNPLIEKEYYISDRKLTNLEIEGITSWEPYSDIVQITDEGSYIIYVKVKATNDINDEAKILNTDILVLDLTGASIAIKVNDKEYQTLSLTPGYTYIDRTQTITIEAEDNLSGIKSVGYYITTEVLSNNALNQLSDNNWIDYVDPFVINQYQKYIIYAKVIDNSDYVTFVNTNYIIYDGYTETKLTIGRNENNYLNANNNITNKSTITLNVSYSKNSDEINGNTHNFVSNILLPLGTKLTLIDKITSKVYEYEVITENDEFNFNNSCSIEDTNCIKKATYPFTLFNEKGTGSTKKNYTESNYYDNGTIIESFTIVVDLSNTNITKNYENVLMYLELHNSNNINIRPTLYNTIKPFNIYSTVNGNSSSASLNITTDYVGGNIQFNSNSTTNVNITSSINYKYLNDSKINDTTYENKEVGIVLKIVDNHGLTVNDDYLKNIIVKVGTNEYYPENDNKVHIDLNNGIEDTTKTITIITKENNANLKEGLYYLKISSYVSNDGIYYDNLSDVEVSIPINIVSTYLTTEHSFNISMDDTNRIIDKSSEQQNIQFKVVADGNFTNPSLRVSLYKKDQLTAFNQNYSVEDLKNYISDDLEASSTNLYYISNLNFDGSENTFSLNLIPQNFENNGYKFVFELYNDTKKVGTLEKLFIVK